MKPRIPLRIGYQYSNWELDLDATVSDRITGNKMYVSYLWIGRNKPFLTFTPNKTELIFYWDRLCAVILTFEDKGNNFHYDLNDALTAKFGSPSILGGQGVRYKYTREHDIEYWCIRKHPHSLVVYGKSEVISLFLPVLVSPLKAPE